MHTISEIAVTVSIWLLATVGTYFSIRAAMRRKRSQCKGKNNVPTTQHNNLHRFIAEQTEKK